jgi:hypothetical protein
MPWWGIVLIALGAAALGGVIGYYWAMIQIGRSMFG